MLSVTSFVIMGAGFGFLMPLWAFAAFSLLALVVYAVFTTGFSGLGGVYDVMFAGIALQVGYFLAVLVHVGRPRLLESADTETTVDTSNKDQARPLSKTRIHQAQGKHR